MFKRVFFRTLGVISISNRRVRGLKLAFERYLWLIIFYTFLRLFDILNMARASCVFIVYISYVNLAHLGAYSSTDYYANYRLDVESFCRNSVILIIRANDVVQRSDFDLLCFFNVIVPVTAVSVRIFTRSQLIYT